MGLPEVAVFLVELVLLAVLAVAGARLGDGVPGVVLAVALPLAAAVLWALRLAPRSPGRLRHPARLVVKLALMVVAAALLALSGAVIWAVVFLLVAAAVVTVGELRERSA